MIFPDIDILIYAYDGTSKHHAAAQRWWEDRLNGSQMIGLSWVVVLGFIRLLTNPRIFQNPFPPPEILAIVEGWLGQPHVRIIHPPDTHFNTLAQCIKHLGTAGNLTTDAHLAAIAIERGLVLHTTDTDFTRFPGLKWRNPLKCSTLQD
jgi:toxin-antitoxin system PIN domain toxin